MSMSYNTGESIERSFRWHVLSLSLEQPGIGKATAALAEAHGWQPIRADLNEGDVKADLATPQGRAAFVDGVTALVGDRLDAAIACAGVALPTPLTVKVNYFGAIATLEGLRPLLAKGTLPRAVGISSFASIMQADAELVEACLTGDEAAALEAAALKVAESKGPEVSIPLLKRLLPAGCAIRRLLPTG